MIYSGKSWTFETVNYIWSSSLRKDCTKREIKVAYHQFARKFHPDKNPDGHDDKMKSVNYAYEILRLVVLRKFT